ncbi:MAG: hypothetical protein DRP68_01710 [Candidatus Omnitrophota bacterium]|nr:MAG: hypothetical protein DRP68_01710 [Candidatus Omnitrophota bacterium]RKY36489.1 MAG: hypothetical protein DRP72_04055 [Candidatus Omnitrophota bacterium]
MEREIPFTFKEIVEVERWQKIQDHFAEVLGITLKTVDRKGLLITRVSSPTRLCEEIMKSSPAGVMTCKECLPQDIEKIKPRWEEGYVCPLGFYNFFIPAEIRGEVLAYVIAGPLILGKYRELDKYREEIERLNIDVEAFLDALREIKKYTFYGIKSVVHLLHDIVCYILEVGYQNLRLKHMVPEFSGVLERVYDFYVEKLLSALLDVSFNFTEAERGSVMLLDEKSGELYIKMAKGLSREVVETTRLRLGEGIAGLVAKEKSPLLIDNNIVDIRIKSRMKRPEIKSSILVPIKVKEKVLGVLNISTSTSSDKFTSQSMVTLDKLTKLVENTLLDLPRKPLH